MHAIYVWQKPRKAVDEYKQLVAEFPTSPRATKGLADALCSLSEEEQSNVRLEECITQYLKVLEMPDAPDQVVLDAGRACADRQQFRGKT